VSPATTKKFICAIAIARTDIDAAIKAIAEDDLAWAQRRLRRAAVSLRAVERDLTEEGELHA